MIDGDAPFLQEFFDIAIAQGVAEVPPHRAKDDIGFKVTPFEQGRIIHGRSPMIWGQYCLARCSRSPAIPATEPVLLPESLKALKRVAKTVGLDLRGAYLNLDAGFDSTHNRKRIFNAGMIPNIKENPRNRKRTKRGRKRFFNAAIHALRTRVDRTFAWEDKFKRVLLRFEYLQQRHFGMKLLAYTLINVQEFCGA
jgi:transposase